MTAEEMKALLGDVVAEAVKPLAERLEKIEAEKAGKIEANASTIAMVEPHAQALESCAAAMEAAGIGLHPQNGHAVFVRRVAGSMRAAAAVGKVPHIFRDYDYPMDAASDSNTLQCPNSKPYSKAKVSGSALYF
jgi:hypothetical protein